MDRAAPGARRTWARSGKAPATSSRWTCCAPSTAKTRCRPCAATSTSCWPKACRTDALAATQQDAIERSFAFAAMAAEGNRAELARQAATLLYRRVHRRPAPEAREPGLETRAVLADLVLRHRLAARDPYSAPATKAPTAPPSCNTRCARPRRRRHSRAPRWNNHETPAHPAAAGHRHAHRRRARSAADAYPTRPVTLVVPFPPAARPTRWRAAWPKNSGSR